MRIKKRISSIFWEIWERIIGKILSILGAGLLISSSAKVHDNVMGPLILLVLLLLTCPEAGKYLQTNCFVLEDLGYV